MIIAGKIRRTVLSIRESRIGLLMGIALAGCASASVAPQASNVAPVSGNRPSTVYVYPFAVNADEVTLNQSIFQRAYRDVSSENQNQSQLQIAQQTAQTLAGALVQNLQGL